MSRRTFLYHVLSIQIPSDSQLHILEGRGTFATQVRDKENKEAMNS